MHTMTTTPNPFESAARAHKAARLVAVISTMPEALRTGTVVRNLDAEGRRLAEQAAGVNPSSDQTWEMVASVLDRRPADPVANVA